MIDHGALTRLALFADLDGSQIDALAHLMDEESFAEGDRVLREGLSGNAFYVITDGRAAVRIDGQERALLHAGDFFGDVSILTGDSPGADVVAVGGELRCAVLPGPELRPLLRARPEVAIRMLEADARRLRAANRWAS